MYSAVPYDSDDFATIYQVYVHCMYLVPCPAKKNCNRNFALTFLILIRWSCASDMFECMVARYCGVVFAVKEFRNVANGSVEFQGHEKKVVQLASASSGLFRMYGTLPVWPRSTGMLVCSGTHQWRTVLKPQGGLGLMVAQIQRKLK